ncbi:MAG: single-stranded-DNA-specific exonuclease RecJ [Cyanobacteria bacterium Co-bin13]|nr:single-stranded-DNA-specific exonuclease RecJ [Cyanobacteria bacterium Co-bin13]
MPEPTPQWQLPLDSSQPPANWINIVRDACPAAAALPLHYTAQLLWQRQVRQPAQLKGFLHPEAYCPASPFAFGEEMTWAVERLKQTGLSSNSPSASLEKVAIWGDFDADGVTATAVLWEGLRPLLPPESHLRYYIPNRFTESHGLSAAGLEQLAEWGCQLLVTCDTGSTSLSEIEYAHQLGMEVIITDHHTLPAQRPPVVALINPRTLPPEHPLQTLSGVAVAYKLIEALYQSLTVAPPAPLDNLLDLVAVGLIADLVELTGDCRYLAQRGLEQLQSHLQTQTPRRPGVAQLLALCKRTGDRPTDISFGIGPRINAISRIHGDARFCVELLTSQDPEYCRTLALEAELANTRRKALQRDLLNQVRGKLAQLDLATTEVIVLADEQWPAGILGLVAGQVAQEYGRPTLLLSLDPPADAASPDRMARGSARSIPGLDLYDLFKTQAHLLTSYGGHPLAAGLSLPTENLALFTAALNREVRELKGEQPGVGGPVLAVDLAVTVADLGQDLFRALKLLEPYGMGNPVPRLLISDCWVTGAWHRRLKDQRGGQVAYIRTEFKLWDDTVQGGFPAEWWDHYAEDLPQGRCDAVVELDFNTVQKQYRVRLVAIRAAQSQSCAAPFTYRQEPILDWRQGLTGETMADTPSPQALDLSSAAGQLAPFADARGKDPTGDAIANALVITQCPAGWAEWAAWVKQAETAQQPLAIAYPPPPERAPETVWKELVGLAKYLSRTGETVTLDRLQERLQLSAPALALGFKSLEYLGFQVQIDSEQRVQMQRPLAESSLSPEGPEIRAFLEALQEEQFRRRYFYQVPVSTLTARS